MKTVTVHNDAGLPTVAFHDLVALYEANGLKAKKGRNIGDLKAAILSMGFTFPLMIWVEGKYIIDGAGRIEALKMLEYEGYEIPEIPYLTINAKDKKHAKQAALAVSSQYGEVTKDSFSDFLLDEHGAIEMDEIDLSFLALPGLTLEEIEFRPQQQKKEKKPRGESASKIVHTCPKCAHEFR